MRIYPGNNTGVVADKRPVPLVNALKYNTTTPELWQKVTLGISYSFNTVKNTTPEVLQKVAPVPPGGIRFYPKNNPGGVAEY